MGLVIFDVGKTRALLEELVRAADDPGDDTEVSANDIRKGGELLRQLPCDQFSPVSLTDGLNALRKTLHGIPHYYRRAILAVEDGRVVRVVACEKNIDEIDVAGARRAIREGSWGKFLHALGVRNDAPPDPGWRRADYAGVRHMLDGPDAILVAWGIRRVLTDRGLPDSARIVRTIAGWATLRLPEQRGRQCMGGSCSLGIAVNTIGLLAAPLGRWITPNRDDAAQAERESRNIRNLAILSRRDPGRLVGWIDQWLRTGVIRQKWGEDAFVTTARTGAPPAVDLAPFLYHLDELRARLLEHARGRVPAGYPVEYAELQTDKFFLGDWYPHTLPVRPIPFLGGPHGMTDADRQKMRDLRRERVERFYGQYHPQWSTLTEASFPVPVVLLPGMLQSIHHVSIERVAPGPDGALRVYFYDPNLPLGDPRWRKVHVSTWGNGERPGEASLEFHEFAVFLHAFPAERTSPRPALPPTEQLKINNASIIPVY